MIRLLFHLLFPDKQETINMKKAPSFPSPDPGSTPGSSTKKRLAFGGSFFVLEQRGVEVYPEQLRHEIGRELPAAPQTKRLAFGGSFFCARATWS